MLLATTPPLQTRPSKVHGWFGLTIALLLGAAFAATRLGDLHVNLQYDGQLPEYLAWAQAPRAWGQSLNAELNRHLYSVYYVGLATIQRVVDRESLLKTTFVFEILALCVAVYHFTFVLTGNRWAAWLVAAVDIWQRGSALAPGGSSTVGIVAGPEYPATALALLALARSWQGRHRSAAVLAGLAFNLHGSIAAFAGAMIIVSAGAEHGWFNRSALAAMFGTAARFVVAAAPTLAWVSFNPPPAASIPMDVWLRFPRWIYPDHMIPSATPLRLWLMLAAFVTPGWLGLAALVGQWRQRRTVLTGWIVATAALLLAGYVFVEWIPIRVVAQLTLFRGSRFLILVLLAFGLSYLLGELRRPGFAGFAAAMALAAYIAPLHPELAWIGHLGLAGLLAVVATRVTGIRRMAAGFAAAAAVGLIVYDAMHFSQLGGYIAWRWPLAAVALAAAFFAVGRATQPIMHAATLVALASINLWVTRIHADPPVSAQAMQRATAIQTLAPVVQQTCPPGQLVVAPPDIRNPGAWAGRGSFLCRQQLTAYAYAPWLADEILRRMQWYLDEPVEKSAAAPIIPKLIRGYHDLAESQFERLRDEYGVRVAIVEADRSLRFRRVGGDDLFSVYDLGEPRRSAPVHASADGASTPATAMNPRSLIARTPEVQASESTNSAATRVVPTVYSPPTDHDEIVVTTDQNGEIVVTRSRGKAMDVPATGEGSRAP